MLVCAAGYPAVYGRQPLYFLDRTFQQRAAIQAPARGDVLRRTQFPLPDLVNGLDVEAEPQR